MNEKKENAKRGIKPDVIVLSALALVALVSLLFIFIFRREGARCEVEIDGTVVAEYSLFENGTYVLNGGTNTLVIENGTAYLINCDCPDKTCEKRGTIRFVGQTRVCLPNRLSVTVRGESDGGVDLVS